MHTFNFVFGGEGGLGGSHAMLGRGEVWTNES